MQTRVVTAVVFFLLCFPSMIRASDFCVQGEWLLTGAKSQADDLSVVYLPEWEDVLKQLAACLEEESAKRHCLVVQGHYDATPIPDTIARVFATQEVAQQARARGRSTAVIRRLMDFGVAHERLREEAPLNEPTYRGVSIVLDFTCMADLTKLEEDRAALEKARGETEGDIVKSCV